MKKYLSIEMSTGEVIVFVLVLAWITASVFVPLPEVIRWVCNIIIPCGKVCATHKLFCISPLPLCVIAEPPGGTYIRLTISLFSFPPAAF